MAKNRAVPKWSHAARKESFDLQMQALADMFTRVCSMLYGRRIDVINLTADAMGKLSGVSSGTSAATDFRNIHFNIDVMSETRAKVSDREFMAMYRGLIYHELGHVTYTPRPERVTTMMSNDTKLIDAMLRNKNPSSYSLQVHRAMELLLMLEESRMENVVTTVDPRTAGFLRTLLLIERRVHDGWKDATHVSNQSFWGSMTAMFYMSFRNYLPVRMRRRYVDNFKAVFAKSFDAYKLLPRVTTDEFVAALSTWCNSRFDVSMNDYPRETLSKIFGFVADCQSMLLESVVTPDLRDVTDISDRKDASPPVTAGHMPSTPAPEKSLTDKEQSDKGESQRGGNNSDESSDKEADDDADDSSSNSGKKRSSKSKSSSDSGNGAEGGDSPSAEQQTEEERLVAKDLQDLAESLADDLVQSGHLVRTKNYTLLPDRVHHRKDALVTAEMRAMANRIGQTLDGLKHDVDPYWERNTDHGRLRVEALVRDPDTDTPFDLWHEGNEEDASYAIAVSFDISSSMPPGDVDTLCRIAWVIKHVSDKAQMPCYVSMYESEMSDVYVAEETADFRTYKKYTPQGGTRPAKSIFNAHSFLANATQPNKLFLMMTDGGWSLTPPEKQEVAKNIGQLNKMGALTSLIVAGDDPTYTLKTYFPPDRFGFSQVIVSQAVGAVFDVAAQFIRASMQNASKR